MTSSWFFHILYIVIFTCAQSNLTGSSHGTGTRDRGPLVAVLQHTCIPVCVKYHPHSLWIVWPICFIWYLIISLFTTSFRFIPCYVHFEIYTIKFNKCAWLDASTEESIKTVFWNVTPCGLVDIFMSLHDILSQAIFLLILVDDSYTFSRENVFGFWLYQCVYAVSLQLGYLKAQRR